MVRFFTLLLSFLLFGFGMAICQTNNYYGTTGEINGPSWNTNPSGPYNQAFNATDGGIMNFNNVAGSNKLGAAMTVAGINVNANFTLGSVTISNFQTYNSGVISVNVASGVVADFKIQPFSNNSSSSGYIKDGDGTFITGGGTYGGGFTLNSGTLAAAGVNAMGGGASNTLTINGGTIATLGTTVRNLSGKYPNGITIGGDFTLGSSTYPTGITFSNNVNLGSSANRTITLGGTGTFTFSGVISGANSGITVNNTSGGGTLTLSGQNTYTGLTTLDGGTLGLSRAGGGTLPSTNSITVNGGTLLISTNQTLDKLVLNGGTVSIASGVTLTINGSIEYGPSGTISGPGSLSVSTSASVGSSGADGFTPTIMATCGCGSSNTFSFTGTSAQVTGTGFPSTVAGLVIDNSNNVSLSAPLTVTTLTLTAGKLLVGDNDLTVTNLSGADETKHIVTNGNGSLVQTVSTSEKEFPVASSTDSYDPVSITPSSGSVFKVNVVQTNAASDFPGTISDYNKVVKRKWSVVPTGSPGSAVLKLKNGAANYFPTVAKMGHFKTATNQWEELNATYSNHTWTALTLDFSPFGAGDQGGFMTAFPVELTYFNAEKKGNSVHLAWQTASERNHAHMVVERSSNGVEFHEIGKVPGNGNSDTPQDYGFVDTAPSVGYNYYRLAQVDFDGTVEYHKVAVVSFDVLVGEVTLIPSVVKEGLSVSYSRPTSTNGVLEIWTVSGQRISSEAVSANTTKSDLQAAMLNPGAYLLRGRFGNQVWVKHFVKL